MFNCSVGIMAYNEEKNIANLLSFVLKDKAKDFTIKEIIVVASGCTDKTEMIVKDFSQKDPRVRLLSQKEREGKSSAINLWLKEAKGDIMILESADTLPENSFFEKLLSPFSDPSVGMTGGRPIPVNDQKTFLGFSAHLLWKLHHLIALENPKMGEVVAFRNVVREIPKNSAVDEASIEKEIKRLGYKIVYVPDAIVKNKGSENIADFIRQRRRIHSGHLWLRENFDHQVSTMSGFGILRILLLNFPLSPRGFLFVPGTVFLEVLSRFLGWYDFQIKKKNPHVWEIAASTKNLSKSNL